MSLHILLIRTGIASNPRPESYFCCVCQRRLHPNSTSATCNTCNRCSPIKTCPGCGSQREWTIRYLHMWPLVAQNKRRTHSPWLAKTRAAFAPQNPTALFSPQPSSRLNFRVSTNQQLLAPHIVCSVQQIRICRNVILVKCNSCFGCCHFGYALICVPLVSGQVTKPCPLLQNSADANIAGEAANPHHQAVIPTAAREARTAAGF